jgi:hypothetical protein
MRGVGGLLALTTLRAAAMMQAEKVFRMPMRFDSCGLLFFEVIRTEVKKFVVVALRKGENI